MERRDYAVVPSVSCISRSKAFPAYLADDYPIGAITKSESNEVSGRDTRLRIDSNDTQLGATRSSGVSS